MLWTSYPKSERCEDMDGKQQASTGKTYWLWVLRPSDPRTIISLVLNGVALPQTDPVYNVEVLLDS